MVSEHAETDRDKGKEDVIKKEAFQYKFCTGTVYRRADENLKIHNSRFGREQTFMRLSCNAEKDYCDSATNMV